MTTEMKHVGRLSNTGDRVVVVFRELLDETGKAIDPNSALVIYPDRLQDRYHDRIMDLLESDRAQDSENFYEVLNSKTFHDGNNMLTFLHQRGFLKKVKVDNVTLCPTAQQRIPLRQYNESVKQNNESEANKLNEYADQPLERQKNQADSAVAGAKNDHHVRSSDVTGQQDSAQKEQDESPEGRARALMAQAHIMEQELNMMSQEINRKKDEAYQLDPSLKPSERTSDSEAE